MLIKQDHLKNGRHSESYEVEVVVFDLFGTLISSCYSFEGLRTMSDLLNADVAELVHRTLLSSHINVADSMEVCGVKCSRECVSAVENAYRKEANGIYLRPEVEGASKLFDNESVQIGICSNLTSYHVDRAMAILPFEPSFKVLSCEVGFIKPQIEIYELVHARSRVEKAAVLFVGDTFRSDVLGPRQLGFHSMHISYFEAFFSMGNGP